MAMVGIDHLITQTKSVKDNLSSQTPWQQTPDDLTGDPQDAFRQVFSLPVEPNK